MYASTTKKTLATAVLAMAGSAALAGCSTGADGDYYGEFIGPNVIRHLNIDGDQVTYDLATCDEDAGELVHYDGLEAEATGVLAGQEGDWVVQWTDSTEEEWQGKSPIVISDDAVTLTSTRGLRDESFTFSTNGAGGSADYVAECS